VSVEQQAGPLRYAGRSSTTSPDPTNLADLLERILDKGIVIAGDISISLVDIELLTIKLRLLIASVDKAQEMGIDWWRSDPWLSSQAASAGESGNGKDRGQLESGRARRGRPKGAEPDAIQQRLDRIETALERLTQTQSRDSDQTAPKR
jgi:Gas vesicle protein